MVFTGRCCWWLQEVGSSHRQLPMDLKNSSPSCPAGTKFCSSLYYTNSCNCFQMIFSWGRSQGYPRFENESCHCRTLMDHLSPLLNGTSTPMAPGLASAFCTHDKCWAQMSRPEADSRWHPKMDHLTHYISKNLWLGGYQEFRKCLHFMACVSVPLPAFWEELDVICSRYVMIKTLYITVGYTHVFFSLAQGAE